MVLPSLERVSYILVVVLFNEFVASVVAVAAKLTVAVTVPA